MAAILNNDPIEYNEALMSLALYNFACFTSFYVYNGQVKGLDLHLQRLFNDSHTLFGRAVEPEEILTNVKRFLAMMNGNQGYGVRVTIFPPDLSLGRPGEINQLSILVTGRSAALSDSALSLQPIPALRSMPEQKTVNMTTNLIARAKAQAQGFDDALMIDNGIITEGPTWNIFFGKDNVLTTPTLCCGILPGITRKLLIDAAKTAGYTIAERQLTLDDIDQFDYCFASNALAGVKPVSQIDQTTFDTDSTHLALLGQSYQALPGQSL